MLCQLMTENKDNIQKEADIMEMLIRRESNIPNWGFIKYFEKNNQIMYDIITN